MPEYNFAQRKDDVLNKLDKSYAQKWDKRIKMLCDKINKNPNYFTTSSCSGRVLLMIDKERKSPGLFLWISHDRIRSDDLRRALSSFERKNLVKFKCEPPIIHIVCKNLPFAQNLLEKGQKAGWKNSGIINLRRNFVVELHGTEKLELPMFQDRKFLVNGEFLELITKKSNEKLEKGWKLIKSLEREI